MRQVMSLQTCADKFHIHHISFSDSASCQTQCCCCRLQGEIFTCCAEYILARNQISRAFFWPTRRAIWVDP